MKSSVLSCGSPSFPAIPAAFLRSFPDLAENRGLRFLQGDVTEFTLGDASFDHVIHAATETTAFSSASEEEDRAKTMVEGTRRVLDLVRGGGAKRLLNISSGAVYGAAAAQLSGAKEEDYDAAQPLTVYARGKREAEELCLDSGADFTTARAFAFLGPHLPFDAHFAAGNFLRDALAGGPILVRGDGTALRSYLHPVDLVVWLLRLLLHGKTGRAYNVGSDEVVSTAQLARAIAAACTPAPEVRIQSLQPQGPQNIYLPNIGRVRSELALEISVPLAAAIRRTLDWKVS